MKKLFFFLLVVFVSTDFNAQVKFEPIFPPNYREVNFLNVRNPEIEYADINGDDNTDILIGGFAGSDIFQLKLYTGDGNGNFIEFENIPFKTITNTQFDFADIDGDGDQDILITGYESSEKVAKLFVNNGKGDFSLIEDTPFVAVVNGDIRFADVDNDNDEDVIVSGNFSTSLYLNEGNGNFSAPIGNVFISVSNSDIFFVDIDNDGDLDVFISGEGQVSTDRTVAKFYKNNGNANFTEIDSNLYGYNDTSNAFLDLEGDGDLDFMIKASGTNLVYTNDGTGIFQLNTSTPLSSNTSSNIVAVGDIDNDGDDDVYFGNGKLYLNNGNGNYVLDENTSFESLSYGYGNFKDIDKDGDLDLLISGSTTSGSASRKTIQYFNDGKGVFSTVKKSFFEGFTSGDITFSDIDNDQDIDIAISYSSSNISSTRLYENDGAGNYSEIQNTPFRNHYGYIEFVDVDNDSDEDLMISGFTNGSTFIGTKIYLNNGIGEFVEGSANLLFSNIYSFFIVGDIDNDQDKDIFITGDSAPKMYKNDGTGNFTRINFPFGSIDGAAGFSDIDNDNDLDLVITGEIPGNVAFIDNNRVFKNDGLGNFTLNNDIDANYDEGTIDFADIDSDGDNDLLLTGSTNNDFSTSKIFKNNGSGNFILSSNLASCYNGDLDFSDVDLDGDIDLILVGDFIGGNDYPKLYENNGFGSFSEVNNLPFIGAGSGAEVIFIDIDKDEDEDVLIIGYNPNDNSNHSRLYRNLTNSHLDLDEDGILIQEDNCPSISNAGQEDTDNDNIGDVCDNCINITNTNQKDFDRDGIGDACDNDIDNDGVPNSNDNCNKTPKDDVVDVNGCTVFTLPVNNFNLVTISETCRSANNGKIEIYAMQSLDYNVQLSGNSLDISKPFTSDVAFDNLSEGSYNLCFRVVSQPNYERCYVVTITEPESLSVLSKVDNSKNKVVLELNGAKSFYVEFNGNKLTTSSNEIELDLIVGKNKLKVFTDISCQGTYEEVIQNFHGIKIYPNPVNNGDLTVFIKNSSEKTILLRLYSIVGQEIISKIYQQQQNNLFTVNMKGAKKGVYVLEVNDGNNFFYFKVIKD